MGMLSAKTRTVWVNAWEYGEPGCVGGGGHDWFYERKHAEDAFRAEVDNCNDSWTAYLVEVSAPAELDGDALTDYIDDGLVEYVPDGRVVDLLKIVGRIFFGFEVLNAAQDGASVLPLAEPPAEGATEKEA